MAQRLPFLGSPNASKDSSIGGTPLSDSAFARRFNELDDVSETEVETAEEAKRRVSEAFGETTVIEKAETRNLRRLIALVRNTYLAKTPRKGCLTRRVPVPFQAFFNRDRLEMQRALFRWSRAAACASASITPPRS